MDDANGEVRKSMSGVRENEKTPVAGLPNRANEKQTSGSDLLGAKGDSSSNANVPLKADANIDKNTLSTKSRIRKYKNGDFAVDTTSLSKAFKGIGDIFTMRTYGGSKYTLLRTENGDAVAIRLSDHAANGENFRRDNANNNLSIVIERRSFDVRDSDIEYTEATIPFTTFEARPKDVVNAIVKGMEDVLADKSFTLDSSLGRVEVKGGIGIDDRQNLDGRKSLNGDIEKEYPAWLEGTTTTDGKHTTQIAGTIKTYSKVGKWILERLGKSVSVLDASSGMGFGTRELRRMGLDVEDVEPYQSTTRKETNPATYDDYGKIQKQYDVVLSNAVLNVLPDDWRRDVLHSMVGAVKPGGVLFVNTRKAGEERSVKDKIELESPQEILVKRNGRIASYQRFFKLAELRDWVQGELGDGWDVAIANKENSGTSGLAAIVAHRNDDEVRKSLSASEVDGDKITKSHAVGIGSELGQPSRSAAPVAKFDANISVNFENATRLGELLEKINERGALGNHEFLYEITKALGSNSNNLSGSRYFELGNGVQLRISDHQGNADTFNRKNHPNDNVGLVVKLSKHLFRDARGVDYVEFVYYPDKLDGKRQHDIIKGLTIAMENGGDIMLPKPDRCNVSGKYKDNTTENSDIRKSLSGAWSVDGAHVFELMSEREKQEVLDMVDAKVGSSWTSRFVTNVTNRMRPVNELMQRVVGVESNDAVRAFFLQLICLVLIFFCLSLQSKPPWGVRCFHRFHSPLGLVTA